MPACTVSVNGEATRSCVTALADVEGADIKTIDLREMSVNGDGTPLEIINSLEPHAYGIDMTAIEL